jgi:F0F1-type ATP synthase alpha subunit
LQKALFDYLDTSYPQVGQEITKTRDLSSDTESLLRKAIQEAKAAFGSAS